MSFSEWYVGPADADKPTDKKKRLHVLSEEAEAQRAAKRWDKARRYYESASETATDDHIVASAAKRLLRREERLRTVLGSQDRNTFDPKNMAPVAEGLLQNPSIIPGKGWEVPKPPEPPAADVINLPLPPNESHPPAEAS